MRKLIAALVAAALWLPSALLAQGTTTPVARFAILASNFDLDGEAADADQVVASATLADSTSYTIAANPDVCRLVDVTITDADASITAGVLTVVGTDCWDAPLTASFTFAAGGSGVKTLTVVANADGTVNVSSGAYFKTIATVSNGLLTGEGVGDALTVGYTSNSVPGYPMYGRYESTPSGRRRVDPFGSYSVNCLVKSGATSVDVIAVSASTTACFQNVAVGDMVIFNVNGEVIQRKVATRTDADTITVNSKVAIPAAGVNFAYKKFFFSTDPIDGWFPVAGWDTVSFAFEVDANADTGGVISNVECATFLTSDPPGSEVEVAVDTATVATGATGEDVTTVDLRLTPHYTHCRVGVKFGTGDDTDTANEDIDLVIGLRR
jgi:hypothetical protein